MIILKNGEYNFKLEKDTYVIYSKYGQLYGLKKSNGVSIPLNGVTKGQLVYWLKKSQQEGGIIGVPKGAIPNDKR